MRPQGVYDLHHLRFTTFKTPTLLHSASAESRAGVSRVAQLAPSGKRRRALMFSETRLQTVRTALTMPWRGSGRAGARRRVGEASQNFGSSVRHRMAFVGRKLKRLAEKRATFLQMPARTITGLAVR